MGILPKLIDKLLENKSKSLLKRMQQDPGLIKATNDVNDAIKNLQTSAAEWEKMRHKIFLVSTYRENNPQVHLPSRIRPLHVHYYFILYLHSIESQIKPASDTNGINTKMDPWYSEGDDRSDISQIVNESTNWFNSSTNHYETIKIFIEYLIINSSMRQLNNCKGMYQQMISSIRSKSTVPDSALTLIENI